MGNYKSPVQEISDFWEWYDLALKRGWTDGLLVAPPTAERVEAIVRYLGREPDEVVGAIPPAYGVATVEQIAIQCVMAGCYPEHVPVVLAAVDAMLDPVFNLDGVQSTTNPCAPLAIVNGPVAKSLGFHTREGAFGGGSHAAAAIGRAIRLVLWNIGGGIPGQTDMATQGQPAKYLFCVAENEEDSPWEPLHVERGFRRDDSVVTVFACQSPDPLLVPGGAERLLNVLAHSLPTAGVNMFHAAGQYLLSFSIKPAAALARAGYSKADVRRWLYEHARFDLGQLRRSGVLMEGDPGTTYWGHAEGKAPDLSVLGDDVRLPMVTDPEQIHLLVAGGNAQWWMGFSAGWGTYGGYAVSRPVHIPKG